MGTADTVSQQFVHHGGQRLASLCGKALQLDQRVVIERYSRALHYD